MFTDRPPRRLPGFRFETQPPPLNETLPRMDVAIFVGFAASGPLHTPVPVEDATQFAAIFGADAPLAWDAERGERVYAQLGPAVRAFFRNGGRRCWVVRVAGTAKTNTFPIPGLVRVRFGSGGVALSPATAQARSPGSWPDGLQVGAALLSHRMPVARFTVKRRVVDEAWQPAKKPIVDFQVASRRDIAVGDLLRLTFHAEGYGLMFVAAEVKQRTRWEGRSSGNLRVIGSQPLWFKLASPPVQGGLGMAQVFGPERGAVKAMVPPDVEWSPSRPIELDLLTTMAEAPAPGMLVRAKFGRERLWLSVSETRSVQAGSPPSEAVRVVGEGFWVRQSPPRRPLRSTPDAEVLRFELRTRQSGVMPQQLGELGFDRRHPRFWGALPTDKDLYQLSNGMSMLMPSEDDDRYVELRSAARMPRFPLAGSAAGEGMFVPVGMTSVPAFLGAHRLPGTPLERDGLELLSAALFLDGELRGVGLLNLLNQADDIRCLRPQPRPLQGIHAALAVDEATIIAVPDAVQRAWRIATGAPLVPPSPSAPVPRPEWWRFQLCESLPQPVPPPDSFRDCGVQAVVEPILRLAIEPDDRGTFSLDWRTLFGIAEGANYILAEATSPNWSDAATIYSGPLAMLNLYGRRAGDYYYRVRAIVNGISSEWSVGLPVRVAPPGRWELLPVAGFSPNMLLAVHRALLRMCAARGDLLAVLALPEHYREEQAVSHASVLRSPLAAAIDVAGVFVSALSVGEAPALSCGTLYHPWLIGREEHRTEELRSVPPDGAASGILAHRALSRGAWIAPANELLQGVVALTPSLEHAALRLQEAQVNLVRQEPRGFLTLSADTLTTDIDLRPINVRRLLMLLRRLALRNGARYVFEPNSDAFRRRVQRGFEAVLELLFTRGAFAGSTPATSYRVVTDSTVNPPQSVDQGRFIVVLQVAPSLPLTFLTIRLVQTGDRSFVMQER